MPDRQPTIRAATSAAVRSEVGRFAPSPSGPLHFGSLVAAVGSFLDARCVGGQWLVRIEDVDQARTVPGASDAILRTLERFGMHWDGPVLVQSARLARYQAALDELVAAGQVFGCACSRREIADSAVARDGGRIYPGTCRAGLPAGRSARALRVRVAGCVSFDDLVQGPQREDLEHDVGDFVLLRADRQFAYQLAVVVDDHDSDVTRIVRGADLLGSTGRQIFLQRLLGYATPSYAHLPVAVDARGDKLSKQTLATAIDARPPGAALVDALRFLGQAPPDALVDAPPPELWSWALAHWSLRQVPPLRALPAAGVLP